MTDENPEQKKLQEFLSKNSAHRTRLSVVERSLKLADSKLSESLSEKSYSRKTPLKNGYSPDTSMISVNSHKSDHPNNNSTTTSNNSILFGEPDSDAEDPDLPGETKLRDKAQSVSMLAGKIGEKAPNAGLSQSMKLSSNTLKHSSEYKKSTFSDHTPNSSDEKRHYRENSEGSSKKFEHKRPRPDHFMPISEENTAVNYSPSISRTPDLGLDNSIFPAELINFSEEIRTKSNAGRKYLIDVIEYAYQIKDKNHGGFYDKRGPTECHYNIYFKGETLTLISELTQKVSDLLNKSILAMIKDPQLTLIYNNALDSISNALERLKKSNNTPIKFTEKDLRKMYEKITIANDESCSETKSCAYCNLLAFLRTTLKKFPSPSNPAIYSENVIVEFISLPKLLENFVNPTAAPYFKTTVIYTYDLYITAMNLLFYLIMRYFAPRPLVMTNSEYVGFNFSHIESKVYILNIIATWIDLRKLDFVRTPNIVAVLNAFLEFIEPKEKNDEVRSLIRSLFHYYNQITDDILKSKSFEYETPRLKESKIKLTQKAELIRTANTSLGIKFLSSFQFPTGYELMVNKEGMNYQTILEESAELIAGQLTLIDWKNFVKIDVSELICKRWTSKDKTDCPYYWKYVKRFNSFSYWIQYVILSQEELSKREDLAKTFLKIASLCIKKFKNFCSPHSIFGALLTLRRFRVIRFETEDDEIFKSLESIFHGDHISQIYDENFRNLDNPAVPDIQLFLRIFMKMQDGVEFMVRMSEPKMRMLKFPLIIQIKEYCDELKRFQKSHYNLTEDDRVYNFLKEDFKKGFPVNFDDTGAITDTLRKLNDKIKERNEKMLSFFNINSHATQNNN